MRKILLKPPGDAAPIELAVSRTDTDGRELYEIAGTAGRYELELAWSGPLSGWMRRQGRVIPFRVRRDRGTLQVWLGGRTHTIELVERLARRSASDGRTAARTELTAPMPGSILKIHVAAGESFEAHAPLIVMVSMKMELALSAPHGGRIKEVRCKEGQLVEMGAILATFEG